MNDEWDVPTGEYERPLDGSAEASRSAGRGNGTRASRGVTARELRMVDAFLSELAIEAAEDPSPASAEELIAIDDLRDRAERLKVMSPDELAAERERLMRLG